VLGEDEGELVGKGMKEMTKIISMVKVGERKNEGLGRRMGVVKEKMMVTAKNKIQKSLV
jgi:hypothetical protein